MSLSINSTNKVKGTKQATHNRGSYKVAADPTVEFGNDEVGLDLGGHLDIGKYANMD